MYHDFFAMNCVFGLSLDQQSISWLLYVHGRMCFVELHWAEDPSFRTNCVFYKYKHWSTRHILQKIQLSGHKCSPAELPSSRAWTLYVVNSILCVCVQCAWNREPVSAPKSPAKSCRSLPFYNLQLLWRQKEVQYVCQHNICTVAVYLI